jgi:4-carboxymuconolactone decarboxylase
MLAKDPIWIRKEITLSEEDRYERGAEMLKKVYAGDVQAPPKGTMAFSDLMVESLFAEVWTRDVLSIRDRRLILLGVIGALGEKDTFAIQAKATLKNEELTPEQLREVVIVLANYAGYPRAAGVLGVVEQQIAAFSQGQKTAADKSS